MIWLMDERQPAIQRQDVAAPRFLRGRSVRGGKSLKVMFMHGGSAPMPHGTSFGVLRLDGNNGLRHHWVGSVVGPGTNLILPSTTRASRRRSSHAVAAHQRHPETTQVFASGSSVSSTCSPPCPGHAHARRQNWWKSCPAWPVR
jgi:hypothetical protein